MTSQWCQAEGSTSCSWLLTVEVRNCHHNRIRNASQSSNSKHASLKRLPEGKLFIIHMRFHQVAVRHFVRGCARSQQTSAWLLLFFFFLIQQNFLLLLLMVLSLTPPRWVIYSSHMHLHFCTALFFIVSGQWRALCGSDSTWASCELIMYTAVRVESKEQRKCSKWSEKNPTNFGENIVNA